MDWRIVESRSALSCVISVFKISLMLSRIRVLVDLVDVRLGVDEIGGCGVGGAWRRSWLRWFRDKRNV